MAAVQFEAASASFNAQHKSAKLAGAAGPVSSIGQARARSVRHVCSSMQTCESS